MKTTPAPPVRNGPIRISLLDIVTARLAAAHRDGAHASPIFGCYLCLHGIQVATPEVRELDAAA